MEMPLISDHVEGHVGRSRLSHLPTGAKRRIFAQKAWKTPNDELN